MKTLAGLFLLQLPSRQAGGLLSIHRPAVLYVCGLPLTLAFFSRFLVTSNQPCSKSIKWKIPEISNLHVSNCIWFYEEC